ncbi:MAG: hypothetical protein QHH07_07240 [Sedimentisphaerales bacterium]|jgi:hypothetical protein|nr:hypothetical protein [Sedimentisphaerales bacterium]
MGIFLDDTNLSTDAGIYQEFISNRSFKDADTPEYWQLCQKEATPVCP